MHIINFLTNDKDKHLPFSCTAPKNKITDQLNAMNALPTCSPDNNCILSILMMLFCRRVNLELKEPTAVSPAAAPETAAPIPAALQSAPKAAPSTISTKFVDQVSALSYFFMTIFFKT